MGKNNIRKNNFRSVVERLSQRRSPQVEPRSPSTIATLMIAPQPTLAGLFHCKRGKTLSS
ncbi:hypothetical protein IFO70_24770 [Phormidium tenue FACHB-886]|nr:hypothetical protein [Phormidium tenue FACHB-886]